jgi:hypothetical protein
MRHGSLFLLAGLLVAGMACAHGRGGAANAPQAQSADSIVQLNVTSNYTLPMDVYIVGSGIRRRLGTVSPGITSHFVVPKAMIGNGPVEFTAGGADSTARSGQLLLGLGDIVDFVIANPLFNSRATVRR